MASVASGISVTGKEAPCAVVGFGGYVSFPTVVGAVLRGIPVYIHEQNALAGKTNLLMARFAKGVFASYEGTLGTFGGKAILTGNPSRYEGIERVAPDEAKKQLGLEKDRRTIFVFGGSQGAAKINEAMLGFAELCRDRDDLQVLHLVGKSNYEEASKKYAAVLEGAAIKVDVRDYLHEMHLAYFASDIVMCRAGATSIAEVTSLGLPSVLVPYPFAAEDHQRLNARELESAGAALVLEDADLTGELLKEEFTGLLSDADRLARMGKCSAKMYQTGAAERMAEVLKAHI